jgi:hypothetical protein
MKTGTVMCNVGTIMAYRLWAREANIIAREMDCPARELQFLRSTMGHLTPKEKG